MLGSHQSRIMQSIAPFRPPDTSSCRATRSHWFQWRAGNFRRRESGESQATKMRIVQLHANDERLLWATTSKAVELTSTKARNDLIARDKRHSDKVFGWQNEYLRQWRKLSEGNANEANGAVRLMRVRGNRSACFTSFAAIAPHDSHHSLRLPRFASWNI